MKQKLFRALKTKVKAFGFSKKELESVAETLSNNLNLEENASDEDVNEAIENAVDSVIPFLKVSQAAASRAIQAFKDAHPEGDADGDKDEKEPLNQPTPPKVNPPAQHDEEPPKWAQQLLSRLDKLETDKVADTRRSRLSKLVDGAGVFATQTLRNFKKMQFNSDDEFDEYLDEIKNDLAALNQERANEGLGKLGAPGVAPKPKEDKPKPVTDAELDELAKNL